MNDMSHSDLSHYVSDCTVLGKLEPNCRNDVCEII